MLSGTNNFLILTLSLKNFFSKYIIEFIKYAKCYNNLLRGPRDKEELGSLVVNQSNKISKLEGERMEYQKKIIEVNNS